MFANQRASHGADRRTRSPAHGPPVNASYISLARGVQCFLRTYSARIYFIETNCSLAHSNVPHSSFVCDDIARTPLQQRTCSLASSMMLGLRLARCFGGVAVEGRGVAARLKRLFSDVFHTLQCDLLSALHLITSITCLLECAISFLWPFQGSDASVAP